jgi:hypothetical protein
MFDGAPVSAVWGDKYVDEKEVIDEVAISLWTPTFWKSVPFSRDSGFRIEG